ncbi:unnamed protein product [Nesidiocoris tenuis]|uniref:Uncharacterized protein n=1 Tax=Nesidiocoris tenuis TaxID=355587 RepID=A0A6H5HRB0_9HEMI|nr:unnamed protein product [Nesidiocoris tenuis]
MCRRAAPDGRRWPISAASRRSAPSNCRHSAACRPSPATSFHAAPTPSAASLQEKNKKMKFFQSINKYLETVGSRGSIKPISRWRADVLRSLSIAGPSAHVHVDLLGPLGSGYGLVGIHRPRDRPKLCKAVEHQVERREFVTRETRPAATRFTHAGRLTLLSEQLHLRVCEIAPICDELQEIVTCIVKESAELQGTWAQSPH